MCKKVCNYKNYVTFTIALWFSSDRDGYILAEKLYKRAKWQAKQWEKANEKLEWNQEFKVKFALESECKTYFENITAYKNSIQWEVYRASLDMVDWLEIAEDILSD
jgi:hypothetical protein